MSVLFLFYQPDVDKVIKNDIIMISNDNNPEGEHHIRKMV